MTSLFYFENKLNMKFRNIIKLFFYLWSWFRRWLDNRLCLFCCWFRRLLLWRLSNRWFYFDCWLLRLLLRSWRLFRLLLGFLRRGSTGISVDHWVHSCRRLLPFRPVLLWFWRNSVFLGNVSVPVFLSNSSWWTKTNATRTFCFQTEFVEVFFQSTA